MRILGDVAPCSGDYQKYAARVQAQSRDNQALEAEYDRTAQQVRQTKESTLQVDQLAKDLTGYYAALSIIENSYDRCRHILMDRIRETAPGRIQNLTGPRQVGKATLLLELAEQFGNRAIYAAGDDSSAALPGFWERCWADAEERARRGVTVLLLDEIHRHADWSAKLKGHWDRIRRKRIQIHVVATGSSALQVATGSRESLAGRFERLTLSHWPAASLVDPFHRSREEAVQSVVRFGSYPGALELEKNPVRWRAYPRDAIIEPAIGRDVLALGAVR